MSIQKDGGHALAFVRFRLDKHSQAEPRHAGDDHQPEHGTRSTTLRSEVTSLPPI
jgi:hypothetical protein